MSLPALTGLRFVAALAVLVFHSGAGFSGRSHFPPPLTQMLNNGYLGVSLFFVLSGYILTHTYIHRPWNARLWEDFAVARFSRLYPVYLFALALGATALTAPLTASGAAAVLLMVQSWTAPSSNEGYTWIMQAWTLSVELFFYVTFPALLLALRSIPSRTAMVGAGLMAAVIVVLGLSSVPPGTNAVPMLPKSLTPILPVLRWPEFAFGAFLARACPVRSLGGPRWIEVSSMLTAAMIVAIMALTSDIHMKGLVSVLCGLLIVQLSFGAGFLAKCLASRPLQLLGGASYAIYLLQGPLRELCRRHIAHPLDQWISPVLIVGLAIATFLFWEQPSRRLLLRTYHRLANPKRAPSFG